MNYTKGEWKLQDDCVISDIWRWGQQFYKIAEITPHTEGETLANAHLIAAAPELYQALLSVLNKFPEIPEDCEDAYKQAEAAITKAEGGKC